MREDVLSLRAMGGDRVSEEYLKAELYHRAEALAGHPRCPALLRPPRLRRPSATEPSATERSATERAATEQAGSGNYGSGISDDGVAGHSFHIGRRHVHAPDGTPAVIDWRAPVSRPFYRASAADPMNLARRRRFGFSGGELTAYEDELFAGGGGRQLGHPARAVRPQPRRPGRAGS